MGRFLEYLCEADNDAQADTVENKDIVTISTETDLEQLNKDKYLKAIIKFLAFNNTANNKLGTIGKDFFIEVNLDRTDFKRNEGYRTEIKSRKTSRRLRAEYAKNVMEIFESGPLFFSKSKADLKEANQIDFIWYGNKDNIEKYLQHNDALKKFEYGRKMRDNLAKSGSLASRYSIGYFSFKNEVVGAENKDLEKKINNFNILKVIFGDSKYGSTGADDENFWGKLVDEGRNKKEPSIIDKIVPKIEMKCLVDFTVSTSAKVYDTSIKNTSALLRFINGSSNNRNFSIEHDDSNEYDLIKTFQNPIDVLKKIQNSLNQENLKNKSDASDENDEFSMAKSLYLDRSVYRSLFENIEKQRGTKKSGDIVFDLKTLADFKINFGADAEKVEKLFSTDLTFQDVLDMRGFGVILSEILIPFLLLCGFTHINVAGKIEKIIESEHPLKILRVDIPKKSNNPLSDYTLNASIITAQDKTTGQELKFAISAKFGDSFNHSSLLGLIAKQKLSSDEIELDSKGELFKKVYEVAKSKNQTRVDDVLELAKYKDFRVLSQANKVYEKKIKNKYYAESNPSEEDKKSMIAVSADKLIADKCNNYGSFLKDVYDYIFNYYGSTVKFQQIELKKDFSIRRIEKDTSISNENSKEKIAIISVSSYKYKKNGNSKIPVRGRVLQPMAIELM